MSNLAAASAGESPETCLAHSCSLGASIVSVTSCDDVHLPSMMIDDNSKTFWVSTGLKQEFFLQLKSASRFTSVAVTHRGAKQIDISVGATPAQMNVIGSIKSENSDSVHEERVACEAESRLIRFVVTPHDDFVSIHNIVVS